ncbi:MAG: Hsp20/alpha crystallin family protein [Bacteroidia bacterium]|nr:Hsp20/alpha crystallin family protein [Bacteroidia bacterium]
MTYFIKHPSNKLRRAAYHENFPPVNIKEDESGWDIEIVAPGRTKESFKLEVKKDLLTISYEDKSSEEASKGYTRREFRFYSFERSFHLPESVAKEGIKANYESGILKVAVPKSEEAKPEVISIDVS